MKKGYKLTNIILCGGSGTRLWPISRNLMPKQFVKMFDKKSLFQHTVERNSKISNKIFMVLNQEHYFTALSQLEELNGFDLEKSKFLLEAVGRNTAPAISLACFSMDKDELLLVTPSDHLIKNEENYQNVVSKAREFAEDGYLVTFGITPTHPETGFGYIEADGFDVKAFIEKPNFETAEKYLKSGNFYWNSGMFMFKAGRFLEELESYSPEIYRKSLEVFNKIKNKSLLHIDYKDMLSIPEDSIDYAVMEKSNRVKVIPSSIGWSDLGSFDSLYQEFPKDENGNSKNMEIEHISINSKDNLFLTDGNNKKRVIATVDINNLIVVDTGDTILISKMGSSQKVKEIVKKLKNKNSKLLDTHLTAYRPWGTYTVLEDKLGYKIKKIVVKPGRRLSLQKHFHRSEHWIVVSGTATVTVDNRKYLVRPNESTYIKMGEIHRLENEGKIPVILIEVQVGEYTGEDDIVRVEDDFNRVS